MKLIMEFPSIDYALIDREIEGPAHFCSAWRYSEGDNTWGAGHYFYTEREAIKYLRRKLEDIIIEIVQAEQDDEICLLEYEYKDVVADLNKLLEYTSK